MRSPEISLFGSHWNAGLSRDATMDGWDNDEKWLYIPHGYGTDTPPGEEASFYTCDKCEKSSYRDDAGRRTHNSACMFEGALVCRDCEVTGLVYDHETEAQIERCYALANHLGPKHVSMFERQIESLSRGFSFGRPSQTRLFRCDSYSFNWGCTVFGEDGKKHRGMNGGLIQFGPHPTETGVDGYTFRTWDHKLSAERDATPEEVASISWSIHT